MNKDMRQATERELEDWPGVTFTEETGKTHTKVTLHYEGQTRLVVTSSTPSDVRAIPNHLSVLRKEIRALGAERKHIIVGAKVKPEPKTNLQIVKEPIMANKSKSDQIFDLIADLRYSEMLNFAEFLRDVATEKNLRRGDPRSWAAMLQSCVDVTREHKGE
jgi:hypothetical protein